MTQSVLLITAGYDHTIRFWDALSGVCARTIQHPDSQVNSLAISPDKRFLAAAAYGHLRLYDVNTPNPNPVVSFDGHVGNITRVHFHPEMKWFVTCGEDKTVKVWDIRSPTPTRNYAHKSPVNDVVVHPNQGELVSCDQNGSVKIWDLAGNACTHELVPEEDVSMRSVAVSSDSSMLVAGNNKGNCFIWRWTDKELHPVKQLIAHKKYLLKCQLSPNGRRLATCSADGTVKLWDTTDFAFSLDKTLIGHQRWVWDCAYSADSAYLVTASSDQTARLWDLSSGETVRQYTGHHKATVCIALNDRTSQ
ncbi:TOR complex subunit lst8 [Sorochytrium milnesiophthora]